jgi:hypothetical protein
MGLQEVERHEGMWRTVLNEVVKLRVQLNSESALTSSGKTLLHELS